MRQLNTDSDSLATGRKLIGSENTDFEDNKENVIHDMFTTIKNKYDFIHLNTVAVLFSSVIIFCNKKNKYRV